MACDVMMKRAGGDVQKRQRVQEAMLKYDEEKADVFSLGRTLAQLKLLANLPERNGFYYQTRYFEVLRDAQLAGRNGHRALCDDPELQLWRYLDWDKAVSTEFGTLLDGMTHHDPARRFTMADAAAHAWFQPPERTPASSTPQRVSERQYDSPPTTHGNERSRSHHDLPPAEYRGLSAAEGPPMYRTLGMQAPPLLPPPASPQAPPQAPPQSPPPGLQVPPPVLYRSLAFEPIGRGVSVEEMGDGGAAAAGEERGLCLLYTSPSPRDS